MTVKDLKEIINNLPNEIPVLISTEDAYDASTVMVEYHSDGKIHLILSNVE